MTNSGLAPETEQTTLEEVLINIVCTYRVLVYKPYDSLCGQSGGICGKTIIEMRVGKQERPWLRLLCWPQAEPRGLKVKLDRARSRLIKEHRDRRDLPKLGGIKHGGISAPNSAALPPKQNTWPVI